MFIVIDTFDPLYPSIVVDMESGMPLLFETKEEAEDEAYECQQAVVVEI
jgi:hypothetical protein